MKAPGHPLLIGRLLISSRTRAGFARQARQTLDEEKSMKRLILTGALSACALMVAACDQRADEAAEADVTAAEADGAEAGDTSTAAKLVCRFPSALNGLIRTSRCSPDSPFK